MLDGEDEMNNDFKELKVAKPEPLTGAKKQPSSQILLNPKPTVSFTVCCLEQK